MVTFDAPVIVFAIYLVGVLGIGVVASRYTRHDPADFYVADRTLGTVVLAFTMLATVLSAFTFFGVGAVSSVLGFGLYAFIGLAAPFYVLLFILIGVKMYKIGKQRDLVTPPEYVRARYESDLVSVVYILVTGVFLVAFITTQIIGGGVALEALMGIDYVVGIAVIAVFMAIYIHIAGMRGVVWSDLVQALVLFLVLAGVFLWVNVRFGGDAVVTNIVADNPDIFTLRGPIGVWTPQFTLTFMIAFVVGVTAYPQLIQRYFAAENVRIMERSSILYGVVIIPVNFLAVLLGIWALNFVDVGIIPDRDYLIPLMVDALFHPVIFGIAMAAGIAAIMSTADSQALTVSSMLSRDVYREYIDDQISDKREVRITQAFLLVIIALALVLAWMRPAGIFELGELAVAGFATTAPAVFLGMYWRRGTDIAAIVSMLLGAIAMFVFFFDVVPAAWQFGLHYGFVAITVAFVSFVALSLVTAEPSDDAIRSYM